MTRLKAYVALLFVSALTLAGCASEPVQDEDTTPETSQEVTDMEDTYIERLTPVAKIKGAVSETLTIVYSDGVEKLCEWPE